MRNTLCDMGNTFCDMGNTFCAQCCKHHVKQEATHMTYTLSCLIWARQPPITNTTRRIATISPVPMYTHYIAGKTLKQRYVQTTISPLSTYKGLHMHALHSGHTTKQHVGADQIFHHYPCTQVCIGMHNTPLALSNVKTQTKYAKLGAIANSWLQHALES